MWRRILNSPIDWFILVIPLILTITGIITIYTITFNQGRSALATDQTIFAALGLVALIILMFSDYRFLRSLSGVLYFVGLVLLVPLLPWLAVKLPFTLKVFGAYRWLDFGFFQLQPAEVFKLIGAIFSASLLTNFVSRINWRRALSYLLLALAPVLLVLAQPDLGTAAVIAAVFTGVFLAALPPGRIIIALLIVFALAAPVSWSNLKPYQRERVEAFLSPTADPQGQGYNVRQALIAVGSGGLSGRGFGQGSQTVLNFLPVAHTDFVFAGFAEATGFIGSLTILWLYILLIFRILALARDSTDTFGSLLAVGIAAKFIFQITVHIGMNLGLLPVTGIPLPFMSYGGTSLIIDLAAIGILQSIHIRQKKLGFQ